MGRLLSPVKGRPAHRQVAPEGPTASRIPLGSRTKPASRRRSLTAGSSAVTPLRDSTTVRRLAAAAPWRANIACLSAASAVRARASSSRADV